ncbi:CAP domain-containing protein [Pseudoduganella sp. GCM10020061]|uniref:CAP domain-containing protein n=1 Tax=Pseudoduganella sp. GCM10020061 TaxID=3317345 RepID=UPI00362541A5
MHLVKSLSLAALLSCNGIACAAPQPDLVHLVNAYRATPAGCQGQPARSAPPLKLEKALSDVRLRPGTILVAALDAAGYEAEQVDAIQVSGPEEVHGAFDALLGAHCGTLLRADYSAIGTSRSGNTWTVVLARPVPDLARLLPEWEDAGREVLAATNAARAVPRMCGNVRYGAAPPLVWNGALARAARAHSEDMADTRTFSHRGSDNSDVGTRALRMGYGWRAIGENISFGQRAASEAVAGWIDSPGHCANLMNPAMVEMGAAFALRGAPRQAAYWTQVFGKR